MIKIGHSHDTHQLATGETLIIGGVTIDSKLGTVAHSDGDVLTHAIIESIIGALGLGDIGTFFPDTDPKYKNANSLDLLTEIVNLMHGKGFHIINMDTTIFVEQPKMKPYVLEMKQNLSKVLGIDENLLNIKATRGEKVGPIGMMQAISAEAVVLISND